MHFHCKHDERSLVTVRRFKDLYDTAAFHQLQEFFIGIYLVFYERMINFCLLLIHMIICSLSRMFLLSGFTCVIREAALDRQFYSQFDESMKT